MNDNPYQSPVAIESAKPDSELSKLIGWSGLWLLALGINLPIPILFASMVVEGTPWIGIGIALGLMLLGGFAAAKYQPQQLQTMALGGCLTAALQFFPIMHMICGGIAIAICQAVGLASNPDDTAATIHGPAGGFVATILTACPILFVAYISGLGLSKLVSPQSPELPSQITTQNK